jgi:SAM-dependent methyltransferase
MIYHIYRNGRHYDAMFPGVGNFLAFWLRQAQAYGDPILELACGTGRITIPLAQQGFRVTGLDNSDNMLQEARKKAAAISTAVEWVKADMRDFDLGQRFSLIILAANTLCHLLYLADFEATMACVRRHLKPDGKFIIEVFVPDPALLLDEPGTRSSFAEYQDPNGRGQIVVTESRVYEADTQISRITTHHAIPGEQEEQIGRLDMRMYFPQELDALLKYNGFHIQDKFGSFEQTPFDAQAQHQIIICALEPQNTV